MDRDKRKWARVPAAAAVAALTAVAGAGSLAASSVAQGPANSADLSIVKTDSADPVAPGSTFSYTLAVSNAGPGTASNVVVTDKLPGQVTFVSAQSSQGTCANQGKTVTCNLNDLGTGAGYSQPVTITIQVKAPNKAGELTNTATVSSDTKDTKKNNDTDTETTTVGANTGGNGSCAGRAATIVGTGGDDVLVGTNGKDVIRAKGGNDQIKALDGKDFVCAGGGKDSVRGGGENDTIKGSGGRDVLTGQGGSDTLKGGRRGDTLKGGNGDDTLKGGRGKDTCRGGGGDDDERSC